MTVHPTEFPNLMALATKRDLERWNAETERLLDEVVALHDPGRLERLRMTRYWSLFASDVTFCSDISDLL